MAKYTITVETSDDLERPFFASATKDGWYQYGEFGKTPEEAEAKLMDTLKRKSEVEVLLTKEIEL